MSAKDWITLARPSNLPTVWTNVFAGAVLAGGRDMDQIVLLAIAGSIFYCAGMILNDAFDREIDRRERPERPIPSGRVAAGTAFLVGFIGLGAGLALAYFAAPKTITLLAGAALAITIVAYDIRHKKFVLAPLIMGACRVMLYVLAALAVAPYTLPALDKIMWPAIALYAWVVGLTYVARAEATGKVPKLVLGLLSVPVMLTVIRESSGGWIAHVLVALLVLWTGRSILLAGQRKIGPAIVGLIAGISLVDAVALATADQRLLGVIAAFGLLLTLRLQRWVRGT